MTTKRLLVSLDEQTFNEIQQLANANNKSSSKIAYSLIKSSLEIQEDRMFSKLADQRLNDTKAWLNHQDSWK